MATLVFAVLLVVGALLAVKLLISLVLLPFRIAGAAVKMALGITLVALTAVGGVLALLFALPLLLVNCLESAQQ